MKTRVRKAVIPAAGLGTRFLPATKAVPKEMLPIIDTPMIQFIVEEAVRSGIETIVFVTARHKEAIENHFDYNAELDAQLEARGNAELLRASRHAAGLCNVVSIRQKNPMGLGHAVLCAEQAIGDEPFAVLLGDEWIDETARGVAPCTRQLIDVYERTGLPTVAVMEVPQADVKKYGIIGGKPSGERTWKIESVVEKPDPAHAPSRLALPGRYVLTPDIFEHLKRVKPGRGGEIQLTDGLQALARTRGLLGYQFEGDRYDTGDRLGYLEATVSWALRRADLREGMREILKKYSAGL